MVTQYLAVAQLVEHSTVVVWLIISRDRRVTGSIPVREKICLYSTVVVRRTCNAKVCGSIPHGGRRNNNFLIVFEYLFKTIIFLECTMETDKGLVICAKNCMRECEDQSRISPPPAYTHGALSLGLFSGDVEKFKRSFNTGLLEYTQNKASLKVGVESQKQKFPAGNYPKWLREAADSLREIERHENGVAAAMRDQPEYQRAIDFTDWVSQVDSFNHRLKELVDPFAKSFNTNKPLEAEREKMYEYVIGKSRGEGRSRKKRRRKTKQRHVSKTRHSLKKRTRKRKHTKK